MMTPENCLATDIIEIVMYFIMDHVLLYYSVQQMKKKEIWFL